MRLVRLPGLPLLEQMKPVPQPKALKTDPKDRVCIDCQAVAPKLHSSHQCRFVAGELSYSLEKSECELRDYDANQRRCHINADQFFVQPASPSQEYHRDCH